MIRAQQDQLDAIQGQDQSSEAIIIAPSENVSGSAELSSPKRNDHPLPPKSRSVSSASVQQLPRSPLQRPASLSRHSSRGVPPMNSNTSSPSLRPLSASLGQEEWSMAGTRDDSAFYQVETHNLQRENLILKQRIRELGEIYS